MTAFKPYKKPDEPIVVEKTLKQESELAFSKLSPNLQIAYQIWVKHFGRKFAEGLKGLQVLRTQFQTESKNAYAANSANVELLKSTDKHASIPIPPITGAASASNAPQLHNRLPRPIPLRQQPCTQCVCKTMNPPGSPY